MPRLLIREKQEKSDAQLVKDNLLAATDRWMKRVIERGHDPRSAVGDFVLDIVDEVKDILKYLPT